jgi:hypothetical protein
VLGGRSTDGSGIINAAKRRRAFFRCASPQYACAQQSGVLCAPLPLGEWSCNNAAVSMGGDGMHFSADSDVEMSVSVPACPSADVSVQRSKSKLISSAEQCP